MLGLLHGAGKAGGNGESCPRPAAESATAACEKERAAKQGIESLDSGYLHAMPVYRQTRHLLHCILRGHSGVEMFRPNFFRMVNRMACWTFSHLA